ncbi:glycoside hydrolase family 3 C-terminal domain-containing protein [Lachnospiraceae bacterium ZAX-1]
MKYAALINQMTLEEKASLFSGEGQFYTKTVEWLGIPSMYLSDGPHGVRKQAGASDHLGLNASLPATCYPTAATIANSWDADLGEQLGQHLGKEAASQGVNVLLGPGLNIKRSPLCGRNFEYFSEDPYLSGKMAAAYIRGIQAEGICACPKHFAVNSQELLRMHSDSIVDERAFHEIYLTGFEIAVKEGKPLSIMTSYNKINGTYASENRMMLRDILVEKWGFEGFAVTDWGGSNDRANGVMAGNHLEMPTTYGDGDRELLAAVRDGRLKESIIDEMLDEYLQVLFRTQIKESRKKNSFDMDAHHDFARKAATASIVLLKNEVDILPLQSHSKVAVIGDFAKVPRYQGHGSSVVNPTKLDNPLACLKESSLNLIGYAAGFRRHGGDDASLLAEAKELAHKADCILLFLGLDEMSESEGMDRSHMRIHQNQVTLLNEIADINPNIVIIFSGGAPVEMPWISKCKAMLHGYLGGQGGGFAIVDILTGKVNPSGKLAETWPISYDDTPAKRYYPGKEKTSEYRESIYVGYRYYDKVQRQVRFPFGYGLSYTSFEYSDLAVDDSIVTFAITNTGSVAGLEISQLYIGLPKSRIYRPTCELKGFAKTALQPGETKVASIPLDDKAFRYFNISTKQYEVEGGQYLLQIGASSQDIRLHTMHEVLGSDHADDANDVKDANNVKDVNDANDVKDVNDVSDANDMNAFSEISCYNLGTIEDVKDEEWAKLLGRDIPKTTWNRSKFLERNDTFSQLFYAKSWIGRFVYFILTTLKNKSEKKGAPDLNILFIYNMPFRAIAKMMGQVFDLAMVDALLEIFNGHFFKGTGHLIKAKIAKTKATKDTANRLADSK